MTLARCLPSASVFSSVNGVTYLIRVLGVNESLAVFCSLSLLLTVVIVLVILR